MSLTPDTINTIKRNAGKLPPEQIARACGVSLGLVERIAREQGISLRLHSQPVAPTAIFAQRVALPDRRSEHFTVSLRPADAKIAREKAAARFTSPSDLVASVFEGALARGKVDELASAARAYRPGDSSDGG